MKNRVSAFLIGIAFALASGGVCQAMSELVSLTLQPAWPTTADPGTVVLYEVTVTRAGQGRLDVTLGIEGLPAGATASFSPNPVRFKNKGPESLTSTLTITCPKLMAVDAKSLKVTGQSHRQAILQTNQSPAPSPINLLDPPRLALDLSGPDGVRVRGLGAMGASYQIEATADVFHPSWERVGTATADGNGRFTFIATRPSGSRMQYYRALLQAPQP